MRFFIAHIVAMILLLLRGSSMGGNAPWSVPDTFEGVWKTINYTNGQPEALVKLWVEHDTLFGVIIDIIEKRSGETPRCDKCVDSLKGAPLAGLRVVWGCRKSGRSWVRGKYLDISDGKVYRCEIDMNETGNLNVFTYVNRLLKIGRTLKWVRV